MERAAEAGPPGASTRAIQRHYDVGNDFYALFLDPSRSYSCAMFEPGDSLEAAQARKHDWHIEHAGARNATSVLDIGCGWGATLRRLREVHGVPRAVGLTLSASQKAFAESVAGPGVEVRLESWLDHEPEAPYDAIISIGAFEHFARFKISQREKVDGYRRFFSRCRDLLRKSGRMTLQTIAYGDIPRDRVYSDEFIANEIFQESDLPRLADIAESCEGQFRIRLVRDDREDYIHTLRIWFNQLRAHRGEAVALVGDEVFARYERYLRTFRHSFSLGAFQLLRLVLERVDHPRHAGGSAQRRRIRGARGAPARARAIRTAPEDR